MSLDYLIVQIELPNLSFPSLKVPPVSIRAADLPRALRRQRPPPASPVPFLPDARGAERLLRVGGDRPGDPPERPTRRTKPGLVHQHHQPVRVHVLLRLPGEEPFPA